MKKIIFIIAICAICTASNGQSWNLTGNAGTNATNNFIGTTDNVAFKIRTKNLVRITVNGAGKVGIGIASPVFKLDVKGGSINTDSVYRIGGNTVLSVRETANTFIGNMSGFSNTTGDFNTATGKNALYSNITGNYNTAIGTDALTSNVNSYNTAVGTAAMFFANGTFNTAIGFSALQGSNIPANNTGTLNTAVGTQSLYLNITGSNNTASGYQALFINTAGSNNVANGYRTLYSNTGGHSNTAIGIQALEYNTTGSYNTAVGRNAGGNIASLSNFTTIGYGAGSGGSNSNTVEIGNPSCFWIGGESGWFLYSDKRVKDNIQSNVPGLSFISKLNPVTYNLNIHRQNEMCGRNDTNEWEGKYDIEKITQTGFLAQEVEQAAKECNYDFNGVQAPTGNAKLYSIQYASFVVPLVKAVQELDKTNEELKMQNAELKNLNTELLRRMEIIESKIGIENSHIDLLEQNAPNPFTEKTVIRFTISALSQNAELKIYSADGKEIKSFSISEKGAGQIEFSANSFAAGIYNYSLLIDGKAIDSKQMILTK